MKTSLATRFLAVLLMIMLLAAMSMQVFAQEVETVEPVEAASGCTHNWVYVCDTSVYLSYDASGHKGENAKVYQCSICGEMKRVNQGTFTGEHQWTTKSFTGNHYHIGSSMKHNAEYKCKCNCGYSTLLWFPYSCPGNGNCLYP